MPIATVSIDPERFELKSLEGAYVCLKPMTFGQKQRRTELALGDARMKQGKGKGKNKQDDEMSIKLLQRIVSEYEFKNCIVDHNLEVSDGVLMDFKVGTTLDVLHPKIGDEINSLINKMNNFEDDDEDESKNLQSA